MRTLQLFTLALLATAAKADYPIGYQYTPCGDIGQPACSVTPSPEYPDPDPAATQAAVAAYYGDPGASVFYPAEFNANGIGFGKALANNEQHYFVDDQGTVTCCLPEADSWLWIRGINDHNLIVGGERTIGSEDHPEQAPFLLASTGFSPAPGAFPPIQGLPDGMRIFDVNVLFNGLGADDSILIMANSSSGMALLEPLYDPTSTPEPSTFWLLIVPGACLLLRRLPRFNAGAGSAG